MDGFKSKFLTLLLLLVSFVAFGQRGSIINPATPTTNPLDPDGDGWVTLSGAAFSNDGWYLDEFEIAMFGIPKLGSGDVPGDNQEGANCGITDVIPDSSGYSVYAFFDHLSTNKNLIFRFRVGDDNSSVEAYTILIDTDQKFGDPNDPTVTNPDPNYTDGNPGFELDITFIKRSNAGVYVYNIDGTDNCPTEIAFYEYDTHFQIARADEETCGDPDYFYDYFVPFAEVITAYNISNDAISGSIDISESSPFRYAAATNTSATCAMDGNISDVSGVDNTDPLYSGNDGVIQSFIDIVNSQCGTPVTDLIEGGEGFDKEKVTKPSIDQPIVEGQTYVSGTTVESNIWVILSIYNNDGSDESPTWGAVDYVVEMASSGTTWRFDLPSPLLPYDSIVARTQLTQNSVPCGSGGNNTSSTSVTIVVPNKPPVAVAQNLFTEEDTPLDINLSNPPDDPDGNAVTFSIVAGSGPTNGTLSGSGANWTYTPFLNYNGPDSFSFRVTEQTNAQLDSVNVITITVTPDNDPPIVTGSASATSYTSVQTSVVIDGTINVTDVDDANIESATVSITGNFIAGQDVLIFTNTASITGSYNSTTGVLILTGTATKAQYAAALASVRYGNSSAQPNTATRTISFVANDGELNSTPFNKNITFSIDNFPPNIDDGGDGELHYVTLEDTDLVLPNSSYPCLSVSDVEGHSVSISSATSLTNHGITTFSGLCFTYDPTLNFNGEERVRIIVCDNGVPSKCDTVIAVITVTPDNDFPTAVNDEYSTVEETQLNVNVAGGLFSNDSDVDTGAQGALSITQFIVPGNATPITAGSQGTITGIGAITINSDGSFIFIPATDHNNNSAELVATYTLADGGNPSLTTTAEVRIRIIADNDNPVAVNDDTYETREGFSLTGNVLTNDIDPDGDNLSVSQFFVNGNSYAVGSTQTVMDGAITVGTFKLNADGSFEFVPAQYYNNSPTPVLIATYVASDGNGGTSGSATVIILVTPENDDPVLGASNNDLFPIPEHESITLAGPYTANVLDNDVGTDPDGDALSVIRFVINGISYPSASTTIPSGSSASATLSGVGTVTLHSNGDVEFTPVANHIGTVPTITYFVSDGNGGTASATAVITVTPVNDDPVARDDDYSVLQTGMLTENILDNDDDIDNVHADLIVTEFVVNSTTYTVPNGGSNTANLAEGDLTISSDGTITFDPDDAFSGSVPAITYTISDGDGGSANAVVSIEVVLVLIDPVAVNDVFDTDEGDPITLAENVNVLDNDNAAPGTTKSVIEYTVTGYSTVSAGTAVVITDVGTVVINSDGSLALDPIVENFNGQLPLITYTITNDLGGSASATVRINVNASNDDPIAVDDFLTIYEGDTKTGNVLTNDIDVDGDALSVSAFNVNGSPFAIGSTQTVLDGSVTMGTIKLNADGTFEFVAAQYYNNSDFVLVATYKASDGDGGESAFASISIRVISVNDDPIVGGDNGTGNANTDPFTTFEDKDITLSKGANVLDNDSDPDDDDLFVPQFVVNGVTYTIAVNDSTSAAIPGFGTVTIYYNGTLTFDPADNFNGAVSDITYTVSDGNGGTGTAIIKIVVVAVNDKPLATDDIFTTEEEDDILLAEVKNVLSNDRDEDIVTNADVLTVTQYSLSINPFTVYNAGDTATYPGVGKFVINMDGGFAFKPGTNYNNLSPGVIIATYTVSDGDESDEGTVSIIVGPMNDPPSIGNGSLVNDNFTTIEDNWMTFNDVDNDNKNYNILDNDSDIDGDPLTVTQFEVSSVTYPVTAGVPGSASIAEGTLTIYSDGRLTYTPTLYYNGTLPLITYTVSDGTDTGTATVTITVTPFNNAPILTGGTDNLSTPEDPTLQAPFMPYNFCIDVEEIEGDNISVGTITRISISDEMSTLVPLSVSNTSICFDFTPELNFNSKNDGSDPSEWQVEICDDLVCTTVSIVITVTPVNDFPVAVNDTTTTIEDPIVAVTLDILGPKPTYQNDYDVDTEIDPSHGINPASVDLDPSTVAEDKTISIAEGAFSVDAFGIVTYTPTLNYEGPFVTINYTVKDDGDLLSNEATIRINIIPQNDAPVFDEDVVNMLINEDTINTLLNDRIVCRTAEDDNTDAELTYEFRNEKGEGEFVPFEDIYPSDPEFNGCYVYIPGANYNGEAEFSLIVTDPSELDDTLSIKILLIPVNDKPLAVNDYRDAEGGVTIVVDLIENDFVMDHGPNGEYQEFYNIYLPDSVDVLLPLVYPESFIKGPFQAIDPTDPFRLRADGRTIEYTPKADFIGLDSIVYIVCDRGYSSLCDTAVLFINVTYPNFKIYEGLSPNGDEINDYWRIDGIEEYPNNVVRVFDRFNNLVFETKGYRNLEPDNNWRGQATRGLGGDKLPEGTYYYTVYLGNGRATYSGYVFLKRN